MLFRIVLFCIAIALVYMLAELGAVPDCLYSLSITLLKFEAAGMV